MKLSTKSRYVVRALLYLAINFKGKPSPIKVIAKNQGLSVRYLENLLTKLRAAKILKSNKGKGGGFYLAKAPSEINLLEVIEIAEGKLALVNCFDLNSCVDSNQSCQNTDDCVIKEIWDQASYNLKNFFQSVTLQDLIDKYYKKEKK